MTMNTPRLPIKTQLNAIIFAALCAVFTQAGAQTVYKCGDSYGQSPCPGGRAVVTDDARDATQKQQTDDATRNAAKLAKSLEKDRLAQEKAALSHPPAVAHAARPPASKPANKAAGKHKPKRTKTTNKSPDTFVAQVPGSDAKPVRKKVIKKKTATPA